MNQTDILLKQYEIFSQRRQHFGALFWQVPALFLTACALIATVIKDADGLIRSCFLLGIGILLLLISYVAKRLKENEDQYEVLLAEIERSLRELCGTGVVCAPRSRRYGARFCAILTYAIIAIAILICSIIFILTNK